MAETIIKTRVANKYASVAEWQANTTILLSGELAFDKDTGRYKIGDGTKTWSQLEYPNAGLIKDTVNPSTDNVAEIGAQWVNTETGETFILTSLNPVTWNKIAFAANYYTKGEVDSKLATKVDAVTGMGLSSNDYTTAEKELVATIPNKADTVTVNDALALKANAADVYTKTESDAALALKANAADVYTKTEADGLLAAKANSADVYTKTEADSAISTAIASKADLVDGKVPAAQLPSFVDDVLEYDTLDAFPAEGEAGKLYVDKTTSKVYRWSGTQYIEISSSLALGETASTAFPGDRGLALEGAMTAAEGRLDTIEGTVNTLGDLAFLDTVGTQHIEDAAVTSAKLADNAVVTSKIEDAAVTSAKLADNAVVTAKIADAAVTDEKIVAVSASKLIQAEGDVLILNCNLAM